MAMKEYLRVLKDLWILLTSFRPSHIPFMAKETLNYVVRAFKAAVEVPEAATGASAPVKTPKSSRESSPASTRIPLPPSQEADQVTTSLLGDELPAIAESPSEDEQAEILQHNEVLEPISEITTISDVETSKADIPETAKDEAEPSKIPAAKKPTTFSKVSVTKTFLAKSVTFQPAATKSGDKPGNSGLSATVSAKPRLVAKTIGNLSNNQKPGSGGNGTIGPDSNNVWNKNLPAVPTPQKQLTDEQLKQQYGIHLATRLQTTEKPKPAVWADIDEDDDDWLPESLEWNDGTKTAVTPPTGRSPKQAHAVLATPVSPTEVVKKLENTIKPTLVPKRISDLGSSKTILKPGIASQQAKQMIGTVVHGEKAVLKAKTPAPTPTKSPWAPIPTVDAVSPVHPPSQQAHIQTTLAPTLLPQDARAYEPATPMPPTREIATDTFDRSLGSRPEGTSRELFNSANGRYEPVLERRTSLRPERKPAVLQRPKEDLAGQDPESVKTDDSIKIPDPVQIPDPGKVPDPVEIPDPVIAQERIMREKRELAIQRRKEQEASESAERMVRLKKKLELLAGAGKSRKEREAEAAEKTAEVSATEASGPEVSKTETLVIEVPATGTAAIEAPATAIPAMQAPSTGPPATEVSSAEPAAVDTSATTDTNVETEPIATEVSTIGSPPLPSTLESQGERKSQPFSRSPLTNSYGFNMPWGPIPSIGNIWGSSGMGNGTFESSSTFANFPLSSSSILSTPLGLGSAQHTPSTSRAPHGPGPIAPPSRAVQASGNSRSHGIAAWNAAARTLPQQLQTGTKDSDARPSTIVASLPPPPPEVPIVETFNQTPREGPEVLGGRRRFENTKVEVHDPNVNFPALPLPSILTPKDGAGPPPEESSYSTFAQATRPPKIKLPGPLPVVKLPPAVQQQQNAPAGDFTTRRLPEQWEAKSANRPNIQGQDWQARINGLFNRTTITTEMPPSPPRTPPKAQGRVLSIAATSKNLWEETSTLPAATVSLPVKPKILIPHIAKPAQSPDMATRSPIVGFFNQELSFGSTPKVNIPKFTTYADAVRHGIPQMTNAATIKAESKPIGPSFPKAPQGYFLKIPRTSLRNKLVKHRG